MTAIYFDSSNPDDLRRQRLYQGEIYVFSPRPSILALRNHAREMIEAAFDGIDPEFAQYSLAVEDYVAIVAPLKPRFIHHPSTKHLIQKVLEDLNCDMLKTYLDVPRLRMTTSDNYLTAGVGYAFHPHRDTWYSAPMCQLNWWMPIYDFESESSMAFHPVYWDRSVKNGSREFNYYEWNRQGRKSAAQHIKQDTRKQPKAEEAIALDPQIRVVCEAGGIILFSPAHLHSTVPNTSGRTRYSLDFRTVHWDDVVSKGGAANLDSAPMGTSLRDFMRGTDLAPFPSEVLDLYEDEAPVGDLLVYRP
jgi:Phytanoyl-CoA dioxygenase (PhyH)